MNEGQECAKRFTVTVVDMTGVKDFKVVPSGEYPVTLTGVKVKPTKKGDKMLAVLELTINDSDIDEDSEDNFNGQKLFEQHVLAPENLFSLKRTLIAFDADPDELTGSFNLEEMISELNGNKAIAVVVPNEDPKYAPRVNLVKATEEL